MRKPKRVFSLKRPKLRQSWNKTNLYNMARWSGDQPVMNGQRTFFQQKWDAKSRSRAYHGDHIPEKKWVRLFSRNLRSVVDMPPAYLGANDGSEQAAGRGSGLTTNTVTAEKYWKTTPVSEEIKITHARTRTKLSLNKNNVLSAPLDKITPYMQMTYAPLERRLDTAIFRALFASSVRQARQFVIHGAVRVNGKKMTHPSYQLNPGDMFQVDPDKVLYGTGKQKAATVMKKVSSILEAGERRESVILAKLNEEKETRAKSEGSAAAEGEAEAENTDDANESTDSLSETESWELKTQMLESMLVDVKMVLRNKQRIRELSAKDKTRLRLFRTSAKKFLSRPEESDSNVYELIEELQLQMKSLEVEGKRLFPQQAVKSAKGTEGAEDAEDAEGSAKETESKPLKHNRQRMINRALDMEGLTEEEKERAIKIMGYEELTKEEMRNLAQLLKQEAENPVDESKPYATPWKPRDYMAAFAFIPRYLEVNPHICAAVYLRHPVARKGLAEVPTPFPYFTNQLAHNWYLGRG